MRGGTTGLRLTPEERAMVERCMKRRGEAGISTFMKRIVLEFCQAIDANPTASRIRCTYLVGPRFEFTPEPAEGYRIGPSDARRVAEKK